MPLGNDWSLRPDGTVEAFPLRGIQTASVPKRGLVRIEYFASEEAFNSGEISALQLHLSASQAREMARLIAKLSDMLESSDQV